MRLLCRGVSGELTPALLGARPIASKRSIRRARSALRAVAASRCSDQHGDFAVTRGASRRALRSRGPAAHHGEHDQRADKGADQGGDQGGDDRERNGR